MSEEEKEIENIEITEEMVHALMREILDLEKENLYVPRPNLKEKIVELVKRKVR